MGPEHGLLLHSPERSGMLRNSPARASYNSRAIEYEAQLEPLTTVLRALDRRERTQHGPLTMSWAPWIAANSPARAPHYSTERPGLTRQDTARAPHKRPGHPGSSHEAPARALYNSTERLVCCEQPSAGSLRQY